MIGSGGLVVMDEDTCMVEVARFFMHFTQMNLVVSVYLAEKVLSVCLKFGKNSKW